MSTQDRRNFGRVVDGSIEPAHLRDQADGVRRMVGRPPSNARVLALTSGKGGVGKTVLSVNLSLALAFRYKHVVLVDLDLGLPNADILLDMTPKYTLGDVVSGRRSLEEVTISVSNFLKVIPGCSGLSHLANLGEAERTNLVAALKMLCAETDFVVFDTGAGISHNTMDFLAAADEVLVVTTPEPTAVVDAYAVIKLMSQEVDRGDMSIVANLVQDAKEGDRVAKGIAETARKLLNVEVGYRGFVPYDTAFSGAVCRRRPFMIDSPAGEASRRLAEIADSLIVRPGPTDRTGHFAGRIFQRSGR